jgi:hypothetical protein
VSQQRLRERLVWSCRSFRFRNAVAVSYLLAERVGNDGPGAERC